MVAIVDTSHHHPAMSPTRRVEVDPATVGVLDPSCTVLSPLVVLHCPLLGLAVLTSPTSPMVTAVVLVVVVVGWLDDTHPAIVLVVAPVIVLTESNS